MIHRAWAGCRAKFLLTTVLLLGCIFSAPARAQFHSGVISRAAGGAGRAAVDPAESAFLNPASLPHFQRYYMYGEYGWASHPKNGDSSQFAAGLSDASQNVVLPGALTYVRKKTEYVGGGMATDQDIQISLAEFVAPGFSVGLAGHRLMHQESSGAGDVIQDNAHLGFLYTPFRFIGIALVQYDFLSARDDVVSTARLVPKIAAGVNLLLGDTFRLRVDAVRPQKFNDAGRTDLMAGLESFFRKEFIFRFGGNWKETADETYLTAGVGFRGPRMSVDYSYQKDQRNSASFAHMFDLWLPF